LAAIRLLQDRTRPRQLGGRRHLSLSASSSLIALDLRAARGTANLKGGRQSMAQPSQANTDEHWRRTTRLMLIHLGVWFFFGYIIHMFVKPLNTIVIPVLGFPLGFYMAAQGSLIIFVVMLFMFAKQQNRIDSEFGMAEEEE
jgi:putative solute:sodium symporter small subunit